MDTNFSLIGEFMVIDGDIDDGQRLLINGTVNGNVVSDHDVIVDGEVNGNIKAISKIYTGEVLPYQMFDFWEKDSEE